MSAGTFSVIGADVTISGDIVTPVDLHIDGKVNGDITCAGLVQGESGEILGAITTETARIAGRVRGSITSGELVIVKTAHIDGDVHYDTITIEQGAQVEGRLAQRVATNTAASSPGKTTLMLADVVAG